MKNEEKTDKQNEVRRCHLAVPRGGLSYHSGKMKPLRLRRSQGFSLIEVMIVVGIMGIMALTMLTMLSNMHKEIQAADEKMVLQNTQLMITNVLSNPTFCGCLIGTNSFNYSATTWNSLPTAIGSSYDPTCVSQGGAILTVGSTLGNSNLKPISMTIQNITETIAGSGNFSSNLVIDFDQTLLTASRKPISIPLYFKVNMADPVSARSLTSCSSYIGGSGVMSSFAVYSSVTTTSTSATCPGGALLSSCLIEVNSADGQSMFYQQHVVLSGPPGQLNTCSANMTDSNDTYRLVLTCIK